MDKKIGRPKGSKNKEKYYFVDYITDDDIKLAKNKLIEKIEGVKCVKNSKEGEVIYEIPPSDKAIEILFNYTMTKPVQETKSDVKLDGGLNITVKKFLD